MNHVFVEKPDSFINYHDNYWDINYGNKTRQKCISNYATRRG